MSAADVARARRIGRWVALSAGCAHYAQDCEGAALEALAEAARREEPLWPRTATRARSAARRHLSSLTGWSRGRGTRLVLAEPEPSSPAPDEEFFDDLREEEIMREGTPTSETVARLVEIDRLEAELIEQQKKTDDLAKKLEAARDAARSDPRLRALFAAEKVPTRAPRTSTTRPPKGQTARDRIRAYLAEHHGEVISATAMAKSLDLNVSTVRSDFSDWASAGVLVRKLPERPGWWEVLLPRAEVAQ